MSPVRARSPASVPGYYYGSISGMKVSISLGADDVEFLDAYAKAHGGGTIGVSSQQGAAASIIKSDADVAGIGGFSGRESQVTVAWLEQAVREGRIRWVLVDGNTGMGPQDGRTGASAVMSWVQQNGKQVTSGGVYDLSNLTASSQQPS